MVITEICTGKESLFVALDLLSVSRGEKKERSERLHNLLKFCAFLLLVHPSSNQLYFGMKSSVN